MKKSEIKVGDRYSARISGNFVTVEVLSIDKRPATSYRKAGTAYTVKNLKTGRTVVFRSATKFRGKASQ